MLACHPLPRFQLADLVKRPVEPKEFEDFSTTLKSDHDWDEENPIEAWLQEGWPRPVPRRGLQRPQGGEPHLEEQ